MKVFVGGATGALGLPTVRALRRRGHEVFGSTRSRSRAAAIEAAGGTAVILDAFDRDATLRVVREVAPEVVVDLLTALPKTGPRRAADMRPTNETRTVASGNLIEAAIAAGARRYVAESFFLVYGTGRLGADPVTESAPAPIRVAHAGFDETIAAMKTKEERALTAARAGRIEAVVLRFGGFYGPGAGLEEILGLLRKRQLPVVRSKNVTPWVEIEDAAAAVVAAVERGRSGEIYNIAGDEAAAMADVFTALAAAAGAPRPFPVPGFVLKLAAPYLKAVLIDTDLRMSNRKAKTELGWAPAHPEATEAMREIVA